MRRARTNNGVALVLLIEVSFNGCGPNQISLETSEAVTGRKTRVRDIKRKQNAVRWNILQVLAPPVLADKTSVIDGSEYPMARYRHDKIYNSDSRQRRSQIVAPTRPNAA